MSRLVSVIIPCYNHGEFLSEAIDSVVAQIYSEWECIIVNDGSSDNTSAVARSYEARDKRIKLLEKGNGGLSDARNTGIKHSSGTYILPLDADDRIGPNYVKLAVDALEKNAHLRVAYPHAEFFGAMQGPWKTVYTTYADLLLSNSIFCTAMYRRSDYDRVGGYDTSLKTGFEDWEFWIRLLENDDPNRSWVYLIPGTHFYYRIKDNSMVKDLVRSKEVEGKVINRIVAMHLDTYTRYFGGITHHIRRDLANKNDQLKLRKSFISKLLWWLTRKSAGIE